MPQFEMLKCTYERPTSVRFRNRDYVGCVEWLADVGVINICYCLNQPELPLRVNYDPKLYKIYYKDTGLFIASLDEEAQEDLRANKNLAFLLKRFIAERN